MNSPDDEFEDFLRRRKPVFGRPGDELEPPLELDRAVLRQAREAIESPRPHRMFRAPSWGMPVALAATLVLAFTIILRVGTPHPAPKPEVTVQNVSRQIEVPADAAAPAAPVADSAVAGRLVAGASERTADAPSGANPVVDLGVVADRRVAPAAESLSAQTAAGLAPAAASTPAAVATGSVPPAYRRDAKAWLAEIDRLRAAGDDARADAELSEFKREFRAYASAPDR